MGLLRSATGKVGCFPVKRNSLLDICGCRGSSTTGPAPLFGGFKPPGSETQPTLGLGAKLGGAISAESPGKTSAVERSVEIATRIRLDIGSSLRFNSGRF